MTSRTPWICKQEPSPSPRPRAFAANSAATIAIPPPDAVSAAATETRVADPRSMCPSHREGKCERSDLRLLSETDKFRHFFCRTCKLDWIVTRSKEKARAREDVAARRIAQATNADRQALARRKVFGRHYAGSSH